MARVFASFYSNCTHHYLSIVNQLDGGLLFAEVNSRPEVVQHRQRYKIAAGNTKEPAVARAIMSGPSLFAFSAGSSAVVP
jgi:hypothetical protein